MVTNALPSVNSSTVTPLEWSGALPDSAVPPVPTLAASVDGSLIAPPWEPFAAVNAFVAAPGSARIWIVSLMTWLASWVLNAVATPGWPFGFWVGGLAVNATGASMSVAWINSLA